MFSILCIANEAGSRRMMYWRMMLDSGSKRLDLWVIARRLPLGTTQAARALALCCSLPASLCYLLSMRWFSLEEERVMQQSSVSISLSFWEPRYQSSRRLHTSRLVPTQTNKNVATNAIKGLSIPSRSLTRVRSDRDDKIMFLVFLW